jgi:hypothetical protein
MRSVPCPDCSKRYAAVGIAAWCVLDAVEFRAGHGMGTQLATALTNINEALYVTTAGSCPPCFCSPPVRSL